MINVLLFVLGTFLDMAATILICTPIFLPIAQQFGMDPVQFGIVMLINCALGLNTPPVGTTQFVGCAIGGVSVGAGDAIDLAVLRRADLSPDAGDLRAGVLAVAARPVHGRQVTGENDMPIRDASAHIIRCTSATTSRSSPTTAACPPAPCSRRA